MVPLFFFFFPFNYATRDSGIPAKGLRKFHAESEQARERKVIDLAVMDPPSCFPQHCNLLISKFRFSLVISIVDQIQFCSMRKELIFSQESRKLSILRMTIRLCKRNCGPREAHTEATRDDAFERSQFEFDRA